MTELFTNGLLVRNGDTYFPAPVAVAAFGRGVYSIAADQVSGTTELSTVLSVADLSLPSMLSLSARRTTACRPRSGWTTASSPAGRSTSGMRSRRRASSPRDQP